MFFFHKPPFLNLINELLNIKKDGIYIDCTFGCGNYSINILKELNNNGKLLAFECDPKTFFLGKNLINDKRFIFINDNFVNMEKYINKFNLYGKINGIVFDLGLSSYQLNDKERGFSFLKKGPLDMRLNQNIGFTLKNWINKAKKKDIYNIIKKYGQERFSKNIANNIIFFRKNKSINTTFDLFNIINKSVKLKKNFKNQARTFQSFRIFINNELENLSKSLEISYNILSNKGRLLVISFHSLEDIIVKNFIKNKSNSNSIFLDDIPLTFNQINNLNPIKMINLGKYKPSLKDIFLNNNIRSSILRVSEKI